MEDKCSTIVEQRMIYANVGKGLCSPDVLILTIARLIDTFI